jgi:phosphoglycerol transferase MdoB-like AlkP superfamily enzyme
VHGYWAQVASAATSGDATTPLALKIPQQNELRAQYEKFAFYPSPPPAQPKWLHPEIEGRARPRHVIVVGLETAPRAFYPLTTAPDLPTFVRMRQHALVSEHHYTTSPYTRIANFSMLSGLYAPSSGLPVRFGRVGTDGFASVLRTRGYETSYVDSWVLDWLPGTGERAQAQMLGFDTVIDSAVHRDDGVYEVLLKAEEVAFETAFTRIVRAEEHGHKAAVFIGTMLGHGPWPAAEGNESLDGEQRLHAIALVFDRLFGRLLDQLEERGLADDVIIVVAGDHGLRYAEEFESLGRSYSHCDLSFNVPFLLYAPGLIDGTLQLSHPTSHIDISPTLLHLLGVSTDGMLLDGGYMLDERLNDRILFLSNSRLGPLDGLHYRDIHFTYHALSGVAEVGDSSDPPRMERLTEALAPTLPRPLRDPAALLAKFDEHANLVAGRLLERGALLQKTK